MTPQVEWYVSLIQAFIVINLVMATFAYLTLAERKIMGRMQLRYGPNRAGFRGLLQPIADLLKLLNKESFQPTEAIDWAFILGPFLAAFTAPDEGTAMEAWYAHRAGTRVVAYTGGTPVHPWTRFVAAAVCADLEDAVAALSPE